MVLTVGLTLALFAAQVPQGGDQPQNQPLLSASEQKSLRDKLAKWIDALKEYDDAKGNKREPASRKNEKAKEAFTKEWESRSEKVKADLLKSVPDLRGIFDNVFPYDRQTGPGSLRKEELKDPGAIEKDYALFVPKSYKVESPVRSVVVLPGQDDKGNWIECRDWFAKTWDGAPILADTLFHVEQVPKEIELDTAPDFAKVGDEANEGKRIDLALRSLGTTKKAYNLDRNRMFLDGGRGAASFALRLVSYFPDQFAGIVLRGPADVDGIRLGSLTGIPVLLVATADTKADLAKLEQRLNALQADSCTLIDATDEYPFKAAAPQIGAWMDGVKRDLMRSKVVLEPNHPRYNKGYWVLIDKMEPIAGIPLAQRPRIEVEADRKQNRINVKASGIDNFTLLLNDQLVDLDDPKGVTVVVNDKAVIKKRTRDFQRLFQLLYYQKLDSNWLFPAIFDCAVPKPEDKAPEAGDK